MHFLIWLGWSDKKKCEKKKEKKITRRLRIRGRKSQHPENNKTWSPNRQQLNEAENMVDVTVKQG